MADEPKPKIDELLRSWAQERRKGAPPPLHPATRKMLQDEVARVYGTGGMEEKASGWVSRLRAWVPQIAFAGALSAVAIIAILSIRQPSRKEAAKDARSLTELSPPAPPLSPVEKQSELKDQNVVAVQAPETGESQQPGKAERFLKLKREEDANAIEQGGTVERVPVKRGFASADSQSTPALATAVAPVIQQDETRQKSGDKVAEPEEVPMSLAAKSNLQVQKAANNIAVKESLKTKNEPAGESVRLLTTPTVATARKVAVPTVEKVMLAGQITNLGAARRTAFVRLPGAAVHPGFTVLDQFQIEQMGNEIRVLDRDGSVYEGKVEVATNGVPAAVSAGPVGGAAANVARSRAEVSPENAAVYKLMARGTNLTLGKQVVVTGNYYERTNSLPAPENTFSFDAKDAQRRNVPAVRTLTQARRAVIGTATVGGSNQVPVRAVSAER